MWSEGKGSGWDMLQDNMRWTKIYGGEAGCGVSEGPHR